MSKTCLIVEDNEVQRESMRKLVEEASLAVKIFTAENLQEAYKILLENIIDVFVVDIVLDRKKKGDISGVRMVNVLRQIPRYMFTPVIFVTSLEDPQMFAYSNLHCFSYLEKPYNKEEAKAIITTALEYSTPKMELEVLCLRREGVIYPFKVEDIVYIESTNRNVKIHKSNGTVEKMPYMTCKNILQEASNSALVQCGRGVLINLNYIRFLDKTNGFIALKNFSETLDIGRSYLKDVLNKLCN